MWATSGAQNLKSMRLDGTDNSFLIRFLSSHLATLKNQVAGHMGIWTFVTFLEFCEKSDFISKCPNLHRLLKITKGKQIIQNKNSCYLQRDFLLITELEFKLFLICLTKVCTPWSGSSVGRNIVYTPKSCGLDSWFGAHTQLAGWIPGWGVHGRHLMEVSLPPLCFFLSPFPSL